MNATVYDQDCIKEWEKDLEDVNSQLPGVKTEMDNAKRELDCLTAWEAILTGYWKNIQATEKKSHDAENKLKDFRTQVMTIDDYNNKSIQVAEIIYCLIKDFYDFTGSGGDGLKQDVADMLKKIECLNNPEINAETSLIVGNLSELNGKLGEAVATLNDTIDKIVEILRLSYDMQAAMGVDRVDDGIDSDHGFKVILDELLKAFDIFGGDEEETLSPYRHYLFGTGLRVIDPSELTKSTAVCGKSIEPRPVMPLNNNIYYTTTDTELTNTKRAITRKGPVNPGAEVRYKTAKDVHDKLLIKKKGLEEAIAAANGAKGC